MLILDLTGCGASDFLRVIYFFKLILDIVFVVIPIALILLLTIDFAKMMISGDESAQKKTFKLATKRILYAVIVFFVPTIVSFLNIILGDLGVEYSECYNDITIEAIESLAAEEKAIEEAEKAARLALMESKRQEQKELEEAKQNVSDSGTYTVKAEGCDGLVYYNNGVFYKPDSSYHGGGSETKGSAAYGYNKYFYDMLTKFVNDGKAAGFTIKASTSRFGAWRPIEYQEYFACCDSDYHPEASITYTIPPSLCNGSSCYCPGTGKCNNGNTAAYVGTSNHGWGIASDLDFDDSSSRDWAI